MYISYFSSSKQIQSEIGTRVKDLRIAQEMTQAQLAEKSGVSLRTISNLEAGKDVSLSTFIEVLRTLNMLENINAVIPEQPVRPSHLVALGKKRERTRKKKNSDDSQPFIWGDEK